MPLLSLQFFDKFYITEDKEIRLRRCDAVNELLKQFAWFI